MKSTGKIRKAYIMTSVCKYIATACMKIRLNKSLHIYLKGNLDFRVLGHLKEKILLKKENNVYSIYVYYTLHCSDCTICDTNTFQTVMYIVLMISVINFKLKR